MTRRELLRNDEYWEAKIETLLNFKNFVGKHRIKNVSDEILKLKSELIYYMENPFMSNPDASVEDNIAMLFGTTIQAMESMKRNINPREARQLVLVVRHVVDDMTLEQSAIRFKQDHSTVSHAKTKIVNAFYLKDYNSRRFWNVIKELGYYDRFVDRLDLRK